jgi:hypothetical protein
MFDKIIPLTIVAEWSSESKFPKFQQMLVAHATEGFISVGLLAAGLVLAMVFDKKIGWLLVLGGIGFMGRVLGFY